MQVVIPFALSDDPASQQAARALQLPVLSQLLGLLSPENHHPAPTGQALAHEHVLARLQGLPAAPHYPWAAMQAAQLGLDTRLSWAWVTPCHWQIGQGQVVMANPYDLRWPEDEHQVLFETLKEFFKDDGIALHAVPGQQHWLASGEVFAQTPAAPLERVVGRNLSDWLPPGNTLRRLQTEVQMLLYTHPVNDARTARGELPVNSVWFAACGQAPTIASAAPHKLHVPLDLRAPALSNRWSDWQTAWQHLDATLIARLRDAAQQGDVVLHLCSEDRCISLSNRATGLWQKIRRTIRPLRLQDLWTDP